jgi:hypothetical protein
LFFLISNSTLMSVKSVGLLYISLHIIVCNNIEK